MAGCAFFHDRFQVPDLSDAAQGVGIFPDKVNNFSQQRRTRDNLAPAEIHQSFIQAVALRPPAVFRDQHGGILTPSLVGFLQTVEHA